MGSIEPMVRMAYDLIDKGDVDGLLGLFRQDARFFIDGSTRISADHTVESFRRVAPMMFPADGSVKRQVIEVLSNDEWAAVIVHEYVKRDQSEIDYHVVHTWSAREGKFADIWVYPHEYERFAKAWE